VPILDRPVFPRASVSLHPLRPNSFPFSSSSVVRFHTLQLSDLYIIWFVVVCESINPPAFSSSLFCVPLTLAFDSSTLILSCRAVQPRRLAYFHHFLSHLDSTPTTSFHRVAFPFPDRISRSFLSFLTMICLTISHARPSNPRFRVSTLSPELLVL